MWSSRAFDTDTCPVDDDLLGAMYRANENGLATLVETVSSDVRAVLALFCYRRAHLHDLGVAIAATCTLQELVQAGGRVGTTLHGLSRDQRRPAPSHSSRRTISLSTKPLSAVVPLDDDIDEEQPAGNSPAG